MTEDKLYYVKDYPEFGMINLTWVRKIIPTGKEGDYKIYIAYGTKGGYSDTWEFGANKTMRDAVMRCMFDQLHSVYTDETELEAAVEEIAEERKGVEAEEALEHLEKKRKFIDPTDLSQFPEVKV